MSSVSGDDTFMVDINLRWKTSIDREGFGSRTLFSLSCMRCDSPALDVIRETFGFNRVVLKHFLVGGEGLHHLDVPTQRQGVFYMKMFVPGDKNKQKILHSFIRADQEDTFWNLRRVKQVGWIDQSLV